MELPIITAEQLLNILLCAADPRTCLIIGEIVKDGKRIEIVRKRTDSLLTIVDDAHEVLLHIGETASTKYPDPDEMVVRILRPQREG